MTDRVGDDHPPWVVVASPSVRLRAERPLRRRRLMIQLIGGAVLVFAVVAGLSVFAAQRLAKAEAVSDAANTADLYAEVVVQPVLTDGLLTGDQTAFDAVDQAVRDHVLDHPAVVRVKIWDLDGTVLYSDEPRLVGEVFPLGEEERDSLDNPQIHSEVSDLEAPENVYERDFGTLLEVYRPVWTPSGHQLLFEIYLRYDDVTARSGQLWRGFAGVTLSALLLLVALSLPIIWRLLDRISRAQSQRELLLERAVDSSRAERRRIAGTLHDGVVQDLVGVAYELRAVADELPEDPHAPPGQGLGDILRRSEQSCRMTVRALRSLLVELHPGERRAETLEAAIARLAEPLRERGVAVPITVNMRRIPPVDVSELVHRAVQEALRNVDRHAGARTAEVTLTDDGSAVRLAVHDDGRGMTATDLEEQHAAGHMGLRLLAEGIAARGGSLEIESEPGTGTRLTLWLPWS
jgi:signal transduction histidine kinase